VKRILAFASAGIAMLAAGAAMAAEPQPWQLGLPEPVTPLARQMAEFHNLWFMPIITAIVIFVLALLLIASFRFRESRNPNPSKTTHNTLLEVLWTAVPILILVVIAFPSLRLLYATERFEDSEMTLKIIGHQWYWSYEYPDHGNFTFDANMIPEDELEPGQHRLMETDNAVVLPVDTKVRLQMTSGDVLHNWAISDFGVRMDTVPGRLNEAWVQVEKEGTYYGFCSELCGVNHAYMPIMVRVVSKDAFEEWVKQAQEEFAKVDAPDAEPTRIASETPPAGEIPTPADSQQTVAAAALEESR